MEKEFVPYEQALALKELGFDEPCFIYWVYDGVEITYSTSHNKSGWSIIGFKNSQMLKKAGLCTAPTFSQAFRWFREKYSLTWEHQFDDSNISLYVGEMAYPDNNLDFFKIIEVEYGRYNKAYEEAELACLIKLIEIVKKK
tara:strand:- start:3913 stop:4335 length:423 start_codon:yes stop_codon:yes gene_type:complete